MDQDQSAQFPEEFQHIPASFFILNPAAQAVVAGFAISDFVVKMKVHRRLTGAVAVCSAATWAFFHPDRCHKTTWREHWGREWMFD